MSILRRGHRPGSELLVSALVGEAHAEVPKGNDRSLRGRAERARMHSGVRLVPVRVREARGDVPADRTFQENLLDTERLG